MPIYSRNSIGSDIHITANENYSYADMGRILVECTQNDMIVFNAAMRNDFKENAAIREGTMVSSELSTFREFSVKEAWGNLKEKLKKLWEKIKGVFRAVYAKLTVWLVRNGKMFVAMHRKTLANKAGLGNCEIPKYMKRTSFLDKDYADTLAKAAKDTIEAYKNDDDARGTSEDENNKSAETYANFELGKIISGATVSNFAEEFKKKAFEELTGKKFSELGVSVEQMFTNITAKSDAIKKLKKAEREADKSIKTMISTLNKKASAAEKKETGSGAGYKTASNVCSGYERALTIVTRAQIQAIKLGVQQDRMVIGKLVAYTPTKESAVLEQVAWAEGADDFATQEDIPAEEINADDVQSDPDVVVNVEVEPSECNT